MAVLPLVPGINFELEEWATEILEEERRLWRLEQQQEEPTRQRGHTGHLNDFAFFHLNQLNDWLNEEQLRIRYEREVYNALGYVGEYLTYRNRCFSRHYTPRDPWRVRPNPHKLTAAPSMDPWRQLLWEQFDNWAYMPGYFSRRFA